VGHVTLWKMIRHPRHQSVAAMSLFGFGLLEFVPVAADA
jgi:hypothetical protein